MKISVIGFGRMGSFFSRELARLGHDVAVMETDPAKLANLGSLLRLQNQQELIRFAPDILLNAVSLERTAQVFRELVESLPPTTVLADIASIKGELAQLYSTLGRAFLSIHPMFGPTFAALNQLSGHNCIIIEGSDPRSESLFRGLLESRGVTFSQMSFAEHDQMMAYSLAIPFVSSLVFAGSVDRTAVPGTTFKRHRDTAAGLLTEDDQLLAEILFADSTLPQLEKITGRLEYLKHIIRQRDYPEFQKFLGAVRKNFGVV